MTGNAACAILVRGKVAELAEVGVMLSHQVEESAGRFGPV
jgi:hypothetical protein